MALLESTDNHFPSISLPPCLAFHCFLHSLCESFLSCSIYWLFCQLYLTFYANAHLPKYQNFAIICPLQFTYAMTANSESILYTIIVSLAVIVIFNIGGLTVFKKKSL